MIGNGNFAFGNELPECCSALPLPPLCVLSGSSTDPPAGMLRPPSIMLQHPPADRVHAGRPRPSVNISDPPTLFKGVGKIHASHISAPASIRKAARPIQHIRNCPPCRRHLSILPASVPFFKYSAKFPRLFIEVEKIPHPFFKEVVKTP